MKISKTFLAFFFVAMVAVSYSGLTGCHVYSFADVSIPDSIKTIRINFIENRAPYVNPQLSPNLTDGLRRKINNQTRLTQTNNENAHYDLRGTITDYSVSTSGISNTNGTTQTSINRLTVTVNMVLTNTLSSDAPQEITVSRSFDFSAGLSLQAAEATLLTEIVRNLSDEIFNRIFSNW
jgi:hypothetical protein